MNPQFEEFIFNNLNKIQTGLTVLILIMLILIVSGGDLTGVVTWFAAVFAILYTVAILGLTAYSSKSEMKRSKINESVFYQSE